MTLVESIDRAILEPATQLGGSSALRDDFIFFLADVVPFAFVGVLVWLLLAGKTKRRRERNQSVALIGLAGVLIAVGIRYLIVNAAFRPRPFVTYPELHHAQLLPVDTSSFPSGHSLYLFTFAGVVLFAGYRKLGWTLVAGASMVVIARVVAGVHYPSDILGGALIGLLLAKLLVWQSKWVRQQVR